MKYETLTVKIARADDKVREWQRRTIASAKKLDEWIREHGRLLRLREQKEAGVADGKLCSWCGQVADKCECEKKLEEAQRDE